MRDVNVTMAPIEDYELDVEKLNDEYKKQREKVLNKFLNYHSNTRISCDCGRVLKLKSLYLHLRSNVHMRLMMKKIH